MAATRALSTYVHVAVVLLAMALAACGTGGGGGKESPAPETFTISGNARYIGLSDHAGIAVSLENTASPGTIAARTTTAGSGAYAFSDVSAGTYNVYAASDRSVERLGTTQVTVSTGAVTAADLTLTPVGTIAGTVTLTGAADHTGTVVFLAGKSYAAFTSKTGAYTIANVPPGT
ncbi:MAG: hypothetical protein HY423_12480 [Candidatus Lambdaproteobacteria bacterium]|nr:hypothetical protein [Candidatus Lambdaproteobacteria bacterium]